MKYLITHQDYKELNIANTTNHIDTGITTKLKDFFRRHRGMNILRRNNLIVNLLQSLKGKEA